MTALNNDINLLQKYLSDQEWIDTRELVNQASIPGAGNMNYTLRIHTNVRTFIIKQSRAYVEKYPQVAAPEDRVLREAEFYTLIIASPELKARTPELLNVDRVNHVLMMQDLGAGSDYSRLYKQGEVIDKADLLTIMDFAATLHTTIDSKITKKPIRNREMRKLNHEHMYIYPYMEENWLNLDDILPGLAEVANPYKQNERLKLKAIELGQKYLSDGAVLLHGDYFPGSWLRTDTGIKIIDPEFCFFGMPEFEIGVTIAHLMMADQETALIETALAHYRSKVNIDDNLRAQFTAGELIRRILGLAQLPLTIDLGKRRELLAYASNVLLNN